MKEIQVNLTTINFNQRGAKPTWIVIHYTGNNGDTAKGNTDYFKSVNRGASAQYFVDENSIWQCVKDTDTAWAVSGDAYGLFYNGARNTNAIHIEMCSRATGTNLESYYILTHTVENTIELTKYLMTKYNIGISNVCRHYDVTGKVCPAPFVYNNGTITWNDFIKRLGENDMTKEETQKLIAESLYPINKKLEEIQKTYRYLEDIPNWAKETITKLVVDKIIVGIDTVDGKPLLDLTDSELRTIVIVDRLINAKGD